MALKWWISLALGVGFVGVVLGTCGKEKTASEAVSQETHLKYGVISAIGILFDRGFNESVWNAAEVLKDQGIVLSFLETNNYLEYQQHLIDLSSDQEYHVIYGISYTILDILEEVAPRYPQQNYLVLDAVGTQNLANVSYITFRAEEGAFLAGYMAVKMSRTGNIGFIGGMKGNPAVDAFEYGFKAGIAYAKEAVHYHSQDVGSFSDIAKAKALANVFYKDRAVDIILSVAGGAGEGILVVAKENGAYMIAVDLDTNDAAPGVVLASVLKDVGRGLTNSVISYEEGEVFEGQQVLTYGLEEGAVDLLLSPHSEFPSILREELTQLKQEISRGQLSVPKNQETYQIFLREQELSPIG